MPKLVLLGGPPGVGKSSVIQHQMFHKFICLDADKIWDPHKVGERAKAIERVSTIVDEKLTSGENVLLAWVFAKPELYQPIVDKFAKSYDIHQIYLVCESSSLKERLSKRSTLDQFEYALEKLNLIQELPFDKIDTTNMEVSEVAKELGKSI